MLILRKNYAIYPKGFVIICWTLNVLLSGVGEMTYHLQWYPENSANGSKLKSPMHMRQSDCDV